MRPVPPQASCKRPDGRSYRSSIALAAPSRSWISSAPCIIGSGVTLAQLALLPHQPAALAVPAALLLGVALVVKLLAARQRQFDLGAATLVEIELERYQRHAFAL